MKKEITIPQSQKDIPLHKYQEWASIVKESQDKSVEAALEVFVGVKLSQTKSTKQADIEEILETLAKVLQERHELTTRFRHEGVEYGFIPSLEEISGGEYLDAEKYLTDSHNWHKFLAVVYRPITKTAGDTYQIEKYEGSSKYCERMKDVPMHIMTGVSVFFWTLGRDLLKDSPLFSQQMNMMKMTS